jgi:hypothetical protein
MAEHEHDGPAAAQTAGGDYDADALVARLRRNAALSMVAITILVAAIWREPMAVVGALLGGGLVMLNFVFLERLATRVLSTAKPAANPVQLLLLAFRVVLMALMLYGIFALPGVHPIPVALGLSILVLAVVIESLSEVLSAPPPRA